MAEIPAGVYIIEHDLHVLEMAQDLGTSLSEVPQYVAGPGGAWVGSLTVRVPHQGYDAWQGFLDQRRGVSRPFVYRPATQHPRYAIPGIETVTATTTLTPVVPGAASSPVVAVSDALLSADATQYGREIRVSHTGKGLEWGAGAMFALSGTVYRVAAVPTQDADSATLEVVPRLRAAVPAFTSLTEAAINMRLRSRDSGRVPTPIQSADANLDVIEDFS